MNCFMLKPLIKKDWYLQRFVILGYLLAGLLALFLSSIQHELWMALGNLLLISVLIASGFHLAVSSVITERTHQTLPFIMSLPISVREYTVGKIVANLLMYLLPWTVLAIGSLALILSKDVLPDGSIPFITLIFVEILVSYCFVLAVAIITESQAGTIIVVFLGNVLLQQFIPFVSSLPSIKANAGGSSIVWDTTTLLMLLGGIILMIAFLGITFLVQSRKTDFI